MIHIAFITVLALLVIVLAVKGYASSEVEKEANKEDRLYHLQMVLGGKIPNYDSILPLLLYQFLYISISIGMWIFIIYIGVKIATKC